MDVVVWLAGMVVSVVGSAVVIRLVQKRRAARLAVVDRVECALRVTSGQVAGLKGTWHHGTATLSPGRIDFVRGLPGGRGVRPGAVPAAVQVDEIDGRRLSTWREWRSVAPGMSVLSVRSGAATVEWLVVPQQASWARGRVER